MLPMRTNGLVDCTNLFQYVRFVNVQHNESTDVRELLGISLCIQINDKTLAETANNKFCSHLLI